MQPNLEDLLATECDRQGLKVTPEGFRQMLIDVIGRMTDQGLIALPAGSITMSDFIRSYRQLHPEAFNSARNPIGKESGNLTQIMSSEIAQSRRNRSLPSDWDSVRKHHTGLTAQMMDEIAATRQNR